MSKPTIDERWSVCIHEAGHAVAARHLLGTAAPRATVFDLGGGVGGMTDDGGDSRIPKTFGGAVVIAAGKAAERFAASTPAPIVTPSRPIQKLETIAPLEAARLSKYMPDIQSDEQTLAEWCVVLPTTARQARAHDPRRWRERLLRAKWAARQFVIEHRIEILRVAERLYREGAVILEDEEGT